MQALDSRIAVDVALGAAACVGAVACRAAAATAHSLQLLPRRADVIK